MEQKRFDLRSLSPGLPNLWLLLVDTLVSFACIALRLEKVGPTFSSFNPYPSSPSISTDGSKQFQYLNIVFDNKSGPLFLKFNWEEVWHHVTMVANFLDHNNREFKQRRRRRQREQLKSNKFILAKQQLCTCIAYFCTFCTFLGRRWTTATWNILISRACFME